MKTSMVKQKEGKPSLEILSDALAAKSQAVNRRAILLVLERAAGDDGFMNKLIEEGSRALADYELSWEEKAALISGDLGWIEARVGSLTERQKTWLNCRLQQERW